MNVTILAAIVFAVAAPYAQQQPARDAAAAQAAPASTGAIAGVLIAPETGRPVRRARVSISGGDPRISKSVSTDDRGQFSFTELPAGSFMVSAVKPGMLDVTYGQKRPGSGRPGTPIQLVAGQHLDRLELKMPRGGVITGMILDERGEPSFGTTVRAMRYVMNSGERTLQSAGTAQTDDRGIYRINSLLPGDYIVNATPRDADVGAGAKMDMEMVANAKMAAAAAVPGEAARAALDMQKMLDQMAAAVAEAAKDVAAGYAPVYYPGTTIGSSASVVALDIGEEKSGIDVSLQIVPMTNVSGVVTGPDSALPPGTSVILLDTGQTLPGSSPRSARVGPDGRFVVGGVPPGPYTLVARASSGSTREITQIPGGVKSETFPSGTQYWAIADVSVDRGMPPVALTLQPGMSVTGRLVFEGAPVPADVTKVRVSLSPVGQGAAAETGNGIRPVSLEADGKFTLSGLVPGRYRLTLALGMPGWSLKSSLVNGQDSLDLPFEVKANESVAGAVMTMTTRMTDLSGAMQTSTGQPSADYTVIAFASDNRFWTPRSRRIQATRPGTDGRFSFSDLPAGEYRLAAVSDVEPGRWFDPAFLRQLVGSSMAVTLGEGERKTQDLRVAGR